jgi:hypothetical protein
VHGLFGVSAVAGVDRYGEQWPGPTADHSGGGKPVLLLEGVHRIRRGPAELPVQGDGGYPGAT